MCGFSRLVSLKKLCNLFHQDIFLSSQVYRHPDISNNYAFLELYHLLIIFMPIQHIYIVHFVQFLKFTYIESYSALHL